jgi:hypothetical protein
MTTWLQNEEGMIEDYLTCWSVAVSRTSDLCHPASLRLIATQRPAIGTIANWMIAGEANR